MVQNEVVDDIVAPNDKGKNKSSKSLMNKEINVLPQLAHDLSDANINRTDDISASEDVEFKNLLLPAFILRGLTAANFKRPSPIQLRSIPLLRLGLDLIVQSKAGTGKTLVIAMAALETIKIESKRLQVLVVAPTREIALQTKHFISILCSDVSVRTEAFIGGVLVKEDKKNLLGCQIAIGTPGRINSLLQSGDMLLGNVRLYVLDEADKLMEKPLFSQVRSISKLLPPNKQTILCSATFLHPVKEYVMKHMKEPFWVSPEGATRIQEGNTVSQTSVPTVLLGVKQFLKEVPNHAQIIKKLRYKLEEILDILAGHSFTQCIIFSNYQTRAETICHQLISNGWPALSVRGQDEQSHRSASLASFKERQCRVLLTTDVMSRGVDFRGVDLVINLDIPYDSSTYLHRMGRAGRFGSHGCVITLASTGEEVQNFRKILADIDGCVVFSMPSDLSLMKQECDFNNIFFGQSAYLKDDIAKTNELKPSIKDVRCENHHTISGSVSNDKCEFEKEVECTNQPTPDTDTLIYEELNSKIESVLLEDLCPEKETSICKEENGTSEALNQLPECVNTGLKATFPPKNLICDKKPRETAVENASVHLAEALCNYKPSYSTFHSFEVLSSMCSNWSAESKDEDLDVPACESLSKSKDWWVAADIVMTAAKLQLQELRESAMQKPERHGYRRIESIDLSSGEASSFEEEKCKSKKARKKARKSHQNKEKSNHHKTSTHHDDKNHEWLWDESSNLYYVWDSAYSCYYLYNPYLNCYFKWEPESNMYFKWDAVSNGYVLWNSQFSCYKGTNSASSCSQRFGFEKESTNGLSSSGFSENYVSWFALWNNQLRQLHGQVYQVEYLKNMSSRLKKF